MNLLRINTQITRLWRRKEERKEGEKREWKGESREQQERGGAHAGKKVEIVEKLRNRVEFMKTFIALHTNSASFL